MLVWVGHMAWIFLLLACLSLSLKRSLQSQERAQACWRAGSALEPGDRPKAETIVTSLSLKADSEEPVVLTVM